jgi:hypothetical protein
MARYGPKLEREQLLLGRFVDIAAELFAMTATCTRAMKMDDKSVELADDFCRAARLRAVRSFYELHHNEDRRGYMLAQKLINSPVEARSAGSGCS